MPTVANAAADSGKWVGRTEISLASPSGELVALGNADSTQVLLFTFSRTSWVSNAYTLGFTYHRNHGDQDRSDPNDPGHRYDRPVESSRGQSDEATITFRI
ncbi:MAG: hypothetical protein MUC53_05705 [Candidatus Contendobacter sp.]|jgi:hypothetical protein|nr:hypothetical protein [Candidatus Contendobacter sp.]